MTKPTKKPAFDLGVLTRLPKSTLDEVVTRARALLSFGRAGENPVESGENHAWLLAGVMRELQSRGLNGAMPVAVVMQLREYKNFFLPAAASMDPWLRGLLPPDAERAELMALSRLVAECLAERISGKFRAPVCLTTMLRFYAQVPDAVEEAFPDYCKNGWVPVIIRRKGR